MIGTIHKRRKDPMDTICKIVYVFDNGTVLVLEYSYLEMDRRGYYKFSIYNNLEFERLFTDDFDEDSYDYVDIFLNRIDTTVIEHCLQSARLEVLEAKKGK
jgi:hypothetical protein